MDVAHVTEYGKLRYVYVTIDTYSGFMMATAQTGEATKHVIAHFYKCYSCMGTPKVIRTMGLDMLTEYFNDFVPNGILYIRLVFLIIFKGKKL